MKGFRRIVTFLCFYENLILGFLPLAGRCALISHPKQGKYGTGKAK